MFLTPGTLRDSPSTADCVTATDTTLKLSACFQPLELYCMLSTTFQEGRVSTLSTE